MSNQSMKVGTRSMDATEKIAAQFLAKQGYADVIYEPDGNVPPDFLVNGQIAVEVRRLNQSYDAGDGFEGLEEVAVPLWQRVRKLCLSFGPPTDGASWFVFFSFSRPVECWKRLQPKLKAWLQSFIDAPIHQETKVSIGRSVEIDIFGASKPHATFFVIAGHGDQESGGWLIEELQRNLTLCIAEKAEKIKTVRSKYPVWWLVLIDHIAHGLDDFDVEQFKKEASIVHKWDRVVVVDPHNPGRSFDV